MDLIWIVGGVAVGLVLAGVVYKNWPKLFNKAVDAGDKLEDRVQTKFEAVVKKEEAAPAGVSNRAPRKKRAKKKPSAKKSR